MGVVIRPESELGKELLKWEQFPRHGMDGTVHPAGNPYQYRPFPKMLYKAEKREDGRIVCLETEPPIHAFTTMDAYQRECHRVTAFNAAHCMTVFSAEEQERAERNGWVAGGPDKAIAKLHALDDDVAEAAAIAAKAAVRMTSKAQRERATREAATDEHVTE